MLARDVAYELIPFFQRRALHAKLAEALEGLRSGAGGEGPPVAASTIAYHWQQSCATSEVAEWRRALKVRLGLTIQILRRLLTYGDVGKLKVSDPSSKRIALLA